MAEKKFIDAEALTDYMLERYNDLCEKHGDYDHYTTGYGDAIDVIEIAPSADVVEVVRCCDCKHSTINGGDCNSIIVHYVRNEITQLNEAAYSRLDYCSYGERKEQT